MKLFPRLPVLGAIFLAAQGLGAFADEAFSPYGSAKEVMREYPEINQVFDVNYDDPSSLNALYSFVKSTRKFVPGKTIIVTHGPELRAFAKENFEKYYAVMDQMAELSEDGAEFRMCGQALRAAGFEPEDMHGFVTVIPSGFAEIVMLQADGYRYVNPTPLSVVGIRDLEQHQD